MWGSGAGLRLEGAVMFSVKGRVSGRANCRLISGLGRRWPGWIGAFVAISSSFSSGTYACTTFHVSGADSQWTGKSYDWHQGHGLLITNKRGVQKTALAIKNSDQTHAWTSKFGSVTFNQIGREFPNGGMNESGLVVEIMWLDSSEYPADDQRPTLNELQWIQYQLDTAETIEDVIKNANRIRLSSLFAKVHYMACDRSGACATFDFLNGNLEIHSGVNLPVSTLANNSYADSARVLASYEGFGGQRTIPLDSSSLSRFVRASSLALKARPIERAGVFQRGFEILDSVSQGSYTKWQIVYNQTHLEVAFRTREASPTKSIQMSLLEFDCKAPVQTLDLDDSLIQGQSNQRLREYSEDQNDRLIRRALWPISVALPRGTIRAIQAYPASTHCTQDKVEAH